MLPKHGAVNSVGLADPVGFGRVIAAHGKQGLAGRCGVGMVSETAISE